MPAVTVIDVESVPPRRDRDDVLDVRPTLGPHTGFQALEQSLLECAPGRSKPRATGSAEEVLFVLDGEGTIRAGDGIHGLRPESGAYLGPGQEYQLHNTGPGLLRLVAVRIPVAEPASGTRTASACSVRHIRDQAPESATSDREFRIVADPEHGLRSATHFVGYIPCKRAPEHFHTYDEVIHVLDGEGIFHAGDVHEPLGRGSCIQLPARTVHCLENTGEDVMRVVAVFRPAGSPAAAFYPDGSPAHAGVEPVRAP
jgi:mannose-6-phosphate isomerase-like protein (cupin superfamily)